MSIANLFCRKEIDKLTIIPSHPSHDKNHATVDMPPAQMFLFG